MSTERKKTGGRMSDKAFGMPNNSILGMLNLPGNEEMRKLYNKNLREAKAEALELEEWAAAGFDSFSHRAYDDPDRGQQ